MTFIPAWALYAASTAVTVYGAVQSANATAAAADYNAKVSEMQGAAEEARLRRESRMRMGAIRANVAKSGVTSEGTPLLVMAESAELAELDALNARWSGQTNAQLNRMKASSARASIPYSAGASLLSGAANVQTSRGIT